MEKLWKGRTAGNVDQAVDDFNASIRFDRRLWKQDIAGSIAHAEMLGKTGIVSEQEAEQIIEGLNEIRIDIESGLLEIDQTAEDIHSFIEMELTARIGDAGKKLHTARSRNDQVALDMRMYLADENIVLQKAVGALISVFLDVADGNKDAIMPGYTHMQRAQPVTFAQHMLAYAEMFFRDLDRLRDTRKRTLSMPLGAGALAGTTHSIDRDMVTKLLEFKQTASNSMDAVSDRDFAIEMAFCLSMIMVHLSRLAEEVILWSSFEFRFIRLDDAFSTGSSIMPQKKNPDIAELVRGKTGRVFGSLTALLTIIKGLPLAYNKDMQEDKEVLFDAIDTVKASLMMTARMLKSITINQEQMRNAAAQGFLNATDLADYLAKNGVPFRDAYRISGAMVAYAEAKQKTLEELSIDEMKSFSDLFSDDVYDTISLETCVGKRISKGGTALCEVEKQLLSARERLENEV